MKPEENCEIVREALDLWDTNQHGAPNLEINMLHRHLRAASVWRKPEGIMGKSNVIQIRLVSSAETGYFYVTKKNARSATGKMEVRKYDPVARKHVVFREAKIK